MLPNKEGIQTCSILNKSRTRSRRIMLLSPFAHNKMIKIFFIFLFAIFLTGVKFYYDSNIYYNHISNINHINDNNIMQKLISKQLPGVSLSKDERNLLTESQKQQPQFSIFVNTDNHHSSHVPVRKMIWCIMANNCVGTFMSLFQNIKITFTHTCFPNTIHPRQL